MYIPFFVFRVVPGSYLFSMPAGSQLQQAALLREEHRVLARSGFELAVDVLHVGLYRQRRDVSDDYSNSYETGL